MTWILAVALLVIALLGAPLFAVFGAIALLAFHSTGTDIQIVIIELYRMAEAPAFAAIPLFTFAGYLLAESKAPEEEARPEEREFLWGALALQKLNPEISISGDIVAGIII